MARIELENFRNFTKKTINLKPPTIIVGSNAVGKTNIIEALFLISTTNSFKKSATQDLIKRKKDYCKVVFTDQDQHLELRVVKVNQKAVKQVIIDGLKVPLSQLIGQLPTVVFSPESLHIIKGPPQERRSFLNIVLSQSDHKYLLAWLHYQKIKRERNKLLFLINQDQAQVDELEFWDKELIKASQKIIMDRLKLVGFFNQQVPKIYSRIAEKGLFMTVKYHASLGSKLKPNSSRKEVKKILTDELKENLNRDLRYQTTTKGPHRDELSFHMGYQVFSSVASQGEIRSLAFSLKLTEKKYLDKTTNQQAIFLLDDPLSELDTKRAKTLLKLAQYEKSVISALPEELKGLDINNLQIIKLP